MSARYLTEEAASWLKDKGERLIELTLKDGFAQGEIEQAWEEAILDEADRIKTRRHG